MAHPFITTHHRMNTSFTERQRRIYDFLKKTPVAVLSSVDADCNPHGTVIYFAVDTDFQVTFLTKAGTKKYDNLLHNNRIMLTVFDPHTQTTAQVIGEAKELNDSTEINRVAGNVLTACLSTSLTGMPPIAKLQAGRYAAFYIDPVQIRMAAYANPENEGYENIFESVESYEYP